MVLKLVDKSNGYRDFDVYDNIIKRCCPGFFPQKGDIFNVYYEVVENGEVCRRKTGVFYDGISLETTLTNLKKLLIDEEHLFTQQ